MKRYYPGGEFELLKVGIAPRREPRLALSLSFFPVLFPFLLGLGASKCLFAKETILFFTSRANDSFDGFWDG